MPRDLAERVDQSTSFMYKWSATRGKGRYRARIQDSYRTNPNMARPQKAQIKQSTSYEKGQGMLCHRTSARGHKRHATPPPPPHHHRPCPLTSPKTDLRGRGQRASRPMPAGWHRVHFSKPLVPRDAQYMDAPALTRTLGYCFERGSWRQWDGPHSLEEDKKRRWGVGTRHGRENRGPSGISSTRPKISLSIGAGVISLKCILGIWLPHVPRAILTDTNPPTLAAAAPIDCTLTDWTCWTQATPVAHIHAHRIPARISSSRRIRLCAPRWQQAVRPWSAAMKTISILHWIENLNASRTPRMVGTCNVPDGGEVQHLDVQHLNVQHQKYWTLLGRF